MSLIPGAAAGYNESQMTVFLVLAGIFLFNIPFGYWRSNTKRFTIQWMAAIHLPVPVAIGLRFWLLGGSWTLIPAFVAAFAAGQYTGGIIRHRLEKRQHPQIGSCLVMDMVRVLAGPARRSD